MPTSSTYIELGGGYDTNLYIGIAAGQVAGRPLGVVIKPGQSSIRQAVLIRVSSANTGGNVSASAKQ